MVTFKQFLEERYNWRRALGVGGTTVAASALAGATKGGFGLGPLGGAAVGAGIGAAYYALSGNLRKDLKKKPKDWNYKKGTKKYKVLNESDSHPFFKAPKKKSYTNKHEPLVWENMLGTVNAKCPNTGKIKYHHYNYEEAHKYADTANHSDLRICKVKHDYADWPRKGKLALFGVPKKKNVE